MDNNQVGAAAAVFAAVVGLIGIVAAHWVCVAIENIAAYNSFIAHGG